ncbi:class I SAM-dependent methyltransferase [Halochromatium roseum]|uniref:class I SAM-dependent methyltransferase n=1 Tax=Halochromatium roseum TaxID=391920 RepID=UPI001912DD6B
MNKAAKVDTQSPGGAVPVAPTLDGVSRTLLIPLLARAEAQSLWPGVAFDDAAARRLTAQLAVDRAELGSDPFPMRLCISRSIAIEAALNRLLSTPIERTLVLIACGLDTLPVRLDASLAPAQRARLRHWVCADLPPVMALRDQLLPASAQIRHVCASLPDQLDEIAAALDETRPVFILEGVLPYLDAEQVADCLAALGRLAPAGADLLIDGYHPALLAFSRLGNTFRRMRTQFRFGIADPRDYAKMAARIQVHAQHDLLRPLPWRHRKRAWLPSLVASGKPLATLTQLELRPSTEDAIFLQRRGIR